MKITRKGVAFCVVLILVLVVIIGGLRILEPTFFHREENAAETTPSRTVTKDGVAYFPRQDITTILFMGIDQMGPVESSGSYRNYGESDVVMLVILDEKNETYSILAFNRDSMVTMPALGLGGKKAGTFYGQLALAHTYGSGLEDSAENVRTTLQDLLGDVYIDYYVAMNMDAISIMTDSVGGVKVNVTDDFSMVDDSIPMGDVTLTGAQAYSYVRIREHIGDQLNITRMTRHKQFIDGFMKAFNARSGNSDTFVLTTYDKVAPYIVTDCSVNTLTALVSRFAEYELLEIVSPEGENILTEEYYEFHLDHDALKDLVMELFYAPKN